MGAVQVLSRLQAAGFRLHADGDNLTVAPASLLHDDDRSSIVAHKAGLLALLAATPAWPSRAEAPLRQADSRPNRLTKAEGDTAHADPWDDAAIARFQARTVAIRHRRFTEQDAEDLAERLHLRDVEQDDRVLCLECSHYWPGHCGNNKRAGLRSPDIGRDLAALLQRCACFERLE